MDELSNTIRALHQNAQRQTSVAFDGNLTEQERNRELKRLRREAATLGERRELLRAAALLNPNEDRR